jgi:acetyl-CoA synthetase
MLRLNAAAALFERRSPMEICRMSNQPGTDAIQSTLQEVRIFNPPAADTLGFKAPGGRGVRGWHIASLEEYRRLHTRSITRPDDFWSEQAMSLRWTKPWTKVCDWQPPDAKWFVGGTLNACDNCVDRHVDEGHGDEVALIWEGEPLGVHTAHPAPGSAYEKTPEIKKLTYKDLQRETAKLGNALKAMGVKKGDVVTIYMPMVPELAIACLACARIGAAHSVIFGGFAPHAITERVIDAKSKVIITADGGYRRGEIVPLLQNVAEAAADLKSHGHGLENVLVLRRSGHDTAGWFQMLRDNVPGAHWWHETVAKLPAACPCEPMDSEDMLFLLYTSGSTGKPKGILHTTGGYLVYTQMTARLVFNLIPSSGQIFWCSADIGWVTGHSYVLYGCMANRVTTLLYEGAPNSPDTSRFWDIIERHKVTQFYTAPTAIRTFMKWGSDPVRKHNLRSLKVLGTVGEPINPEAWMWYHKEIGQERVPIVDTYWQTETGGHVITPLPGAVPTKPGSCTLPMFGIDAAVVNEAGEEMPANSGGLLVIRRPWPGMLRGVYGNRERFIAGYWNRIRSPGGPGLPEKGTPYYFSADGARRDADGYFWVMGRVDDVINVSGHRLGTMEVESALVSHPAVAEAAVVGMPHEIKGTGICAFVTLKSEYLKTVQGTPPEGLKKQLSDHVAHEIGGLARPDSVRFAEGLPKTRSGKIMRRLLRDVAAGVQKITQDTTTLEDFSVVAKLRSDEE